MGLETPSFELATPIFAGYELKNPGFQVCQPLDQRTEVLDRSNSWLREVLDRSNSWLGWVLDHVIKQRSNVRSQTLSRRHGWTTRPTNNDIATKESLWMILLLLMMEVEG